MAAVADGDEATAAAVAARGAGAATSRVAPQTLRPPLPPTRLPPISRRARARPPLPPTRLRRRRPLLPLHSSSPRRRIRLPACPWMPSLAPHRPSPPLLPRRPCPGRLRAARPAQRTRPLISRTPTTCAVAAAVLAVVVAASFRPGTSNSSRSHHPRRSSRHTRRSRTNHPRLSSTNPTLLPLRSRPQLSTYPHTRRSRPCSLPPIRMPTRSRNSSRRRAPRRCAPSRRTRSRHRCLPSRRSATRRSVSHRRTRRRHRAISRCAGPPPPPSRSRFLLRDALAPLPPLPQQQQPPPLRPEATDTAESCTRWTIRCRTRTMCCRPTCCMARPGRWRTAPRRWSRTAATITRTTPTRMGTTNTARRLRPTRTRSRRPRAAPTTRPA